MSRRKRQISYDKNNRIIRFSQKFGVTYGNPKERIMENESLVKLLVRLTIEKAIREDKHPFEVLDEIKKQFELKRIKELAIKQADSLTISAN